MKENKHLEKAKRLEKSMNKLDVENDWESIVEIAYGIALNYIAIICEIKLGKHRDTHKGLPRFLDDNELGRTSTLFRELDVLRQGRWYGGKQNGETAKQAMRIVKQLRRRAEDIL